MFTELHMIFLKNWWALLWEALKPSTEVLVFIPGGVPLPDFQAQGTEAPKWGGWSPRFCVAGTERVVGQEAGGRVMFCLREQLLAFHWLCRGGSHGDQPPGRVYHFPMAQQSEGGGWFPCLFNMSFYIFAQLQRFLQDTGFAQGEDKWGAGSILLLKQC